MKRTSVAALCALLAAVSPSLGTFHKGKGKGGGDTFIHVIQYGAGSHGHRDFGHDHGGYRGGDFRPAVYQHGGYRPAGYRPGGYRATGYGHDGYRATGYGHDGYRAAGYRPGGYGPSGYGLGSRGGRSYGHGYGYGYERGGYNHHSNLIIEEEHRSYDDSHEKGGFLKGFGKGISKGFSKFFGKGKGFFGTGHDYELVGVLRPKYYDDGYIGVPRGAYGGRFGHGASHRGNQDVY